MIEVLVTVLVMSVGLLGLAGLQMQSLKYNQSAYLRSQATLLAYDVMDRLRANRSNASDYVIDLDTAPSGTTVCTGSSATCTGSELAAFDLNQWKCALGKWNTNSICASTLGMKGLLPNGDGSISQSGSKYTVNVRWDDRDGNTVTLEVSTEL